MKRLLVLSIFLGLTTYSFSQNQPNQGVKSQVDWGSGVYQQGKKYSGYIIKLDGDTVYGYIEAQRRTAIDGLGYSNQNRVEFYLKETDKKPVDKYKPDELKGYLIADKLYESINYSGGLLKKANFNLVIVDGAIRLYEWYSTREGFSSMRIQSGESASDFDNRRYETNLIVAKDPSEPISYSMLGLSFAKKMPELVRDNKELASKIENKETGYTWVNLFELIEEYNNWAEQNK